MQCTVICQSSEHQCTLVFPRDFWDIFRALYFGIVNSDTLYSALSVVRDNLRLEEVLRTKM